MAKLHMIGLGPDGLGQATECGQNASHQFDSTSSRVAFDASAEACIRCASVLRKRDAQKKRLREVLRGGSYR